MALDRIMIQQERISYERRHYRDVSRDKIEHARFYISRLWRLGALQSRDSGVLGFV